MLLFRKHKVLKILKQYHAEYHREIPKDIIAREELLRLKESNLETLALRYDKVLKILKQYHAEYLREIPKDIIAREELLRLKESNLETLALSYDLLKGYEFYSATVPSQVLDISVKYHMPAKSMYMPNVEYLKNPNTTFAKHLRLLEQARFRERGEYLHYPNYSSATVRFTKEARTCWKQC